MFARNKPMKQALLMVIKNGSYLHSTYFVASIAVNKHFVQTNSLYPYKDPRGDGWPSPSFVRGDTLPKATLVERWDLNPWQLDPEAFNELLLPPEWSDLTSPSLASSLL